jgi:hypothetical protein
VDDFVRPETVRLPLSGDHFIDVKKRLNHGEQEDMHARWSPFITPGAPPQFDRREVRTGKVLVYLLGWSLMNNGTPVPIGPDVPEAMRLDTIRSLDPDRFLEIYTAIEAHEVAMDRERAAQKKMIGGSPDGPATSPSPSGATVTLTESAP